MHRVTLIPGDGIGPEVTAAACSVIEAAGVEIQWDDFPSGQEALESCGDTLPPELLESIRTNGRALKGPITTPVGRGFRSVNVRLRQELDLYGNLRPVQSLPGVPSPFPRVNLLVVRENTEELYTGTEYYVGPDAAVAPRIITRRASERVARLAFTEARRGGWQQVTVGHKANILKLTDGLFLESCRRVAADYPDINLQELLVDNLCLQLVRRPQEFQILLLPNLFGDLISDLAAGLVGGLGLAPGVNRGTETMVFEAVHGSAPKHAGTGRANPTALILAGVLLLESLGEQNAATRVRAALQQVLSHPEQHTPDLGGKNSTGGFAAAICQELRQMPSSSASLSS